MGALLKNYKVILNGILELFFLALICGFFFFAEFHLVEWGIFNDIIHDIDHHVHVSLCWQHMTFIGWYWACTALWAFDRLSTYSIKVINAFSPKYRKNKDTIM